MPHRLQYPIGVKTNTSHGLGLMALFGSWLEHTYEYSKEKFDRIATALSGKPSVGKEECMAAYQQFIQNIGQGHNLAELAITKEDVEYLVSRVTGSVDNDPAGKVPTIVETIYKGAFTK